MPTPQRTNPELVAHLKHFEGWVDHPYKCAAGKPTIGYGHRIPDMAHPHLTLAEGEALLYADIDKYEEMALRITKGRASTSPLDTASPRRIAAITDFCFNAGGAAYAGSTLCLRVRAGDWLAAAHENGRWIYVTDPKTLKKHTSAWQINRRAVTSAWLAQG